MKLFLTHSHLDNAGKHERWIEHSISSLLPLLRIEEAHVIIEYHKESSPPYRASAHLKVPGPDLRVQGIDHTVRTAFDRVMEQLRTRAVERASRRLRRRGEQRLRRTHLLAQAIRA